MHCNLLLCWAPIVLTKRADTLAVKCHGKTWRKTVAELWSVFQQLAHNHRCRHKSHSVNLILFTVLLVHLILRISPHHSHHLRSHHLSLPRPFTPDLKLISFTNPFLHSLSGSFWTAFTIFNPQSRTIHSRHWCLFVCFSFFFLYFFFWLRVLD